MSSLFMEKPALTMNLDDFVNALNAEREVNLEIEQALLEKGIFGEVTHSVARQLKSATFSSVGTLTIDGFSDIFRDLKIAGLSKHATIKGYMEHAVDCIRRASVAQ